MKRILATLLALALIISSLLALTSCSKSDGAPDGMALVKGGEDVGYYFYGPEEWVVSNLGSIACTYASKIDTTSMTFTKSEKPAVSVKEYFESEKAKFPFEINVTVDGESCTFGNADTLATKYVYTYTYKDISYTCMQIFVTNADSFYIFTYTANNVAYSDEQTYYQFYLEKATAVIDAFKFTTANPTAQPEPEYVRDADGYILVSDETLAGFKMYVPDSYKVDYSTALISVTNRDGANISMSQLTYTGVTFLEYWQTRMDNINAFANGTCQGVRPLDKDNIETVVIAGTNNAKAYEYTYTYEGVTYHVYQVIIIENGVNGYVFTYTADETVYDKHLEDAKKVLYKVEY